jgi:hypothetical protein
MKTSNAIAGMALVMLGALLFGSAVMSPPVAQAKPLDQVMQLTALIVKNYIRTNALYVNGTTIFNGGIDINAALNVDANLDADSISVAGNIDMTTMNNSGANPVTINDDLVVTGTIVRSSANITPTNGGILTPTADLVTLTPGGALGTAMGACTTGSSTVLYNSVNASVVITDTGNFIGAGNQTLGQYDTLRMVCIDSKWVQVGAVSAN